MSDPHFDANNFDATHPPYQPTTPSSNMPPNGTIPPPQPKPHLFQHVTTADYQAAGTSFGIGIASALALALLNAIIWNHALSNALDKALASPSFALFPQDQTGVLLHPTNLFQNWILTLVLGLSGDLNFTTTMPYMDFSSGFAHIPITLVAIALVVGAAFGSYLFAHKAHIPLLWRGIIGSVCVGIITGLVILILAVITRVAVAVTPFRFTIDGFTIRTAVVSIILAAGGSCMGYYLADRVPDAPHLFAACWRWAHRLRGSMRTCVESAAVFAIVFTIVNIIASVIIAITTHDIFVIPLMVIALPALMLWEIPLAMFGGITAHIPQRSDTVLTLFSSKGIFSFGNFAWVPWLLFVISLLCVCYIALRAGARNYYDPQYARWEYAWQAPVFWLAFWLIIPWLFASIHAQYSNQSLNFAPAFWFGLVSAVWAFLIEAMARLLAPSIIPAVPFLWKFIAGGTVRTKQLPAEPSIPRTATTPSPTAGTSFVPPSSELLSHSEPLAADGAATLPVSTPRKRLTSRQKLIIVLVCVAAGVLTALGITVAILNARVFNASAAVETYITAIENGDFERANQLVPTNLTSAQTPLLTNKAAPTADRRITHARVVDEESTDGGKTVTVQYTLNDKSVTRHIPVVRKGHKALIFANWTVEQPLLTTIDVAHSEGIVDMTINNVTLSANKQDTTTSDTSGEVTSQFAAYPGVYTVSAPPSRYYRASRQNIDVGISDATHVATSLTVIASEDLAQEINTQIKKQFDTCTSGSKQNPSFCPLADSMVMQGDYAIRNVQWSITKYPETSPVLISMNSGTFTSGMGMATVSYEDELLGRWYSHKGPRFLSSFRGSFTIDGDNVHVQFDNNEDE